jgi:hypothetical protein
MRDLRISGNVLILLRDFNHWLAGRKKDECDPGAFLALLEEERFRIIEVAGTHLVWGLGLIEDWKAYFSGG